LPRFSGGAAGGGEVGAARGRAGQWQCRWTAAGSRQETGDRRQAGGGRQSVASDTGPLKGSEAGPGCIVWLPVCLHLSTQGSKAEAVCYLHALSPGAAYASCPPPAAAGRGRADSTRHRRRQKYFSPRRAIGHHVVYHVRRQTVTSQQSVSSRGRRRRRRGRRRRRVHGPLPPLARAMLELEHCHGASLPSQPAIPASILIRFAHRQLANSPPEPRVTCNEGHPPPLAVCRLRY
jgi:hypothetical protein